jgi:hypothetical protein
MYAKNKVWGVCIVICWIGDSDWFSCEHGDELSGSLKGTDFFDSQKGC